MKRSTGTYLNPLYPRNFPDPFVLKFRGIYWAYCTGLWRDGRCFGILSSADLVCWQEIGGAMPPLPGGHPCYWAPEVMYDNGRFYLYYSVGNEEQMQIRVAVADHPAGPFIDSDHGLTQEPFAIDAHPFEDEDGRRYLFYATDFLDHTHIGTGTVVDRLLDPFTLAGNPRPVTRARYDWQVYDPHRVAKGGVRWHTVEGAFVLKRKRRYYQMFSGGNWQNPSYGVGYATSERIERAGEWDQHCDGERVLPILRTRPGQVIGPGHNAVVRGPDNIERYCVYHRWADDRSGRLLAIDRLEWAGERMLVLGPTATPQPVPNLPGFQDLFENERRDGLDDGWRCEGGEWQVRDGEATQVAPAARATARCLTPAGPLLCEVTLRALPGGTTDGACGLTLHGPEGGCHIRIEPDRPAVTLTWDAPSGRFRQALALPATFDPRAPHLLRVVANGNHLQVQLDRSALRWQGWLPGTVHGVSLVTEHQPAAFSGFALTTGWEDLFIEGVTSPERLGWENCSGAGRWRIDDDQLWGICPEGESLLAKGPLLDRYDLVANVRLAGCHGERAAFGFSLAGHSYDPGPRLQLERCEGRWTARWEGMVEAPPPLPLPDTFEPARYQQLRLRREGRWVAASWEGQTLGAGRLFPIPARPALWAREATVAFDMVRVVALGPQPGYLDDRSARG